MGIGIGLGKAMGILNILKIQKFRKMGERNNKKQFKSEMLKMLDKILKFDVLGQNRGRHDIDEVKLCL